MVRDTICTCISKRSIRPRRRDVPCSRCWVVFSEFERSIIRSRVKAGLARARLLGTRSGKPIGQQPLPRYKVEAIRAELQKGTAILKTAVVRDRCIGGAARQSDDEAGGMMPAGLG